MNEFCLISDMVITKSKTKVSCSTPEHRLESPSRDSDSETSSPVPFLCTQDGAEGETDVVWNYYTPKSECKAKSHVKSSTPLSRKAKKIIKPKLIDKPLPKRKVKRCLQEKSELFQELLDLNRNLHELINKKPNKVNEKSPSGSEDDIFNESLTVTGQSPKSGLKNNSRCLRKNLLSSKFSKPEPETVLESDDSMNECLIKASQVVEENVLNCEPTPAKQACYNMANKNKNIQLRDDSMDAILNDIKLDSPQISKFKCGSPCLNNDSFDSLVGNLNDSALERLTQMPVNNKKSKEKGEGWMIKELIVYESPTSKSVFSRHSSMPESPVVVPECKPSTSGMVFGRYNSMPYDQNSSDIEGLGDSPIRCTPDEIKRKHQQAREKLMAKRLLPFTLTQQSQPLIITQIPTARQKNNKFQPKVPLSSSGKTAPTVLPSVKPATNIGPSEISSSTNDIKSIIEKKRQEALLKLRRRQPQNRSN